MKRYIAVILACVLACIMLAGCTTEINGDENDILYNDIVYERTTFPNYNIVLLDDHKKYIGDFLETYDYGNQLPWEVFALNDREEVLSSAHAVWIKPGYTFPDEFGEVFSKAEYVVSEGILDDYREEVTPLVTFTQSVKLEDIIETEPTDITEYTGYADIRLHYKNHADMAVFFELCSYEGEYYLNVCEDVRGDAVLYKIKPEYVEVLTSAIPNK